MARAETLRPLRGNREAGAIRDKLTADISDTPPRPARLYNTDTEEKETTSASPLFTRFVPTDVRRLPHALYCRCFAIIVVLGENSNGCSGLAVLLDLAMRTVVLPVHGAIAHGKDWQLRDRRVEIGCQKDEYASSGPTAPSSL
jgi:hypothetical protein